MYGACSCSKRQLCGVLAFHVQVSLSIMLDQTTDTVNYDMTSKMELTELGVRLP